MRILLTNTTLAHRTGSELYVVELALALRARGHDPVAYSTVLGGPARDLAAAGIAVVDDLALLADPPDLIHGHHHTATLAALLHFPGVPGLFVCHGCLPWDEEPLLFPRLLRHVAVDLPTRERLAAAGVPDERVETILNFVDLERFGARAPLPPAPRRALVFSNNAHEGTHLPVVRAACAAAGIAVDVAGIASGRVAERPERLLPDYDLVFAKGRAAIEALAVGAAVVLCDAAGCGPMVTSAELARLRPINFGFRALDQPLSVEALGAQIARYDPEDAARTRGWIRQQAGLDEAVARYVDLYQRILAEHHAGAGGAGTAGGGAGTAGDGAGTAGDGAGTAGDGAGTAAGVAATEGRAAAAYLRWLDPFLKERARALTDREELWRRVRALAEECERLRAAAARAQPGTSAPSAAGGEPDSRVEASAVRTRAEEMIARHGFLGVPLETFAQAGRNQLAALLEAGLSPESKVLDLGCGCLRAAYWLVRFLDPGCYHGIEPARRRVELGLQYLFTAGDIERKQPRFAFDDDFDSSVFGCRFDYFLAGSIWTHAGKPQIEVMLDAFLRDSTETGVLLATYLPAGSPQDDYGGDRWVGTSHESDVPGVVRHSLAWIVEQCQERALQVTELPRPAFDDQSWLRITRRPANERQKENGAGIATSSPAR
jgi:hypothetical protein